MFAKQRDEGEAIIRLFSKPKAETPELPQADGETTDAIVFAGIKDVRCAKVSIPLIGENDVAFDTTISAISAGTERWALLGRRPEMSFPFVSGYMSVGVIRDVGSKVSNFAAGDRVVAFASRPPPAYGGSWMCAHMKTQVISAENSGELPYCLPVPADVSDEDAAFAALAAVSKRGLDMLAIEPGTQVAVFGLGMVGQFTAQLARSRGANVTAIDLHPGRVLAARNLGARNALVSGANLHDQLITSAPDGFEIVIDTTGSAAAVNVAVNYLRSGGTFLFQGWYAGLSPLDLNAFHNRSAHAVFACALCGSDVAHCMELMRKGELKAQPLITHRFRPGEAPEAYRALLENDPSGIGQVFVW